MAFIKNQAVNGFTFVLVGLDGAAVTTGVVTGYVTKDDGNQTLLANAVRHKGNGQWAVDLEADEMNADQIGLLFTHPDAINVNFTIPTLSSEDTELLGGSSSSSSGGEIDIAELASAPLRVRTAEGTVEERSVDELIKADRYLAGRQAADAVPWGIRVARGKPGSSIGG